MIVGALSRYKDWLKEAEDDLGSAKCLLEGGHYSKSCFHSHQAAEKAVKALLIRCCGRYEEMHSVVGLFKLATESVEVPQAVFEAANRLDRHYIPSRYPNAWPSGAPHERYSKRDAEEAMEDARTILAFVKEKIG
jgi:HEPN domain-containing protein